MKMSDIDGPMEFPFLQDLFLAYYVNFYQNAYKGINTKASKGKQAKLTRVCKCFPANHQDYYPCQKKIIYGTEIEVSAQESLLAVLMDLYAVLGLV